VCQATATREMAEAVLLHSHLAMLAVSTHVKCFEHASLLDPSAVNRSHAFGWLTRPGPAGVDSP
jgi:hypothetical protein